MLIKKALRSRVRQRQAQQDQGRPASRKAQVREIAEKKMPDLNAASIEAAMSMVKGTARSMGVTVADA